jgi:hypothetical protein
VDVDRLSLTIEEVREGPFSLSTGARGDPSFGFKTLLVDGTIHWIFGENGDEGPERVD